MGKIATQNKGMNMIKILKNDLKGIWKIVLFSALSFMIIIAIMNILSHTEFHAGIILFWLPFSALMILYQTESNTGFNKMLLSFPVSRTDFIASRYVLNLVLLLAGLVGMYLLIFILKYLVALPELIPFSFRETVLSSLIIILFSAVFLPFYFRTGNFLLSFLMGFAIPLILIRILARIEVLKKEYYPISLILLMVGCYFISFFISLRIYRKKDF
ncbi:MAG TPA: ABC-2 transporter permease [Candidatus Cloacimonadota bacterium]|nr:ABC-2 transporter permease [Candidatus Cloacimonadota bacterium]